jgi:2-(3-amino-3-carboxypropyl)histidine synthase
MYDLEAERVAEEITRRGAKKVLVQLPDGLRPKAFTLAENLDRLTDAEILLSGDSCYGSCDVALTQAEAVGADLIVHYGHSRMMEDTGTPVLYIEAEMDYDAETLVEKTLPLVEGWDKIGLAATVQHAHKLGEIAESLKQKGLDPLIGPGRGRTPHDGQILGCDYHTAQSVAEEVDGYLFIGAGRFHPLGLALATGKPVVVADPYLSSVEELSEQEVRRLAMRRMAAITAARGADRYGVIVSLKPGQFQLDAAASLRDRIRKEGKKAAVICLDEVGSLRLGNFSEVEAFISTACPRIAVDGVAELNRPILTVTEALVMLGEKRWEEVWGGPYFSP